MDSTPIGKRFSHVYVKRGTPASDSARMRHRIASLIDALPDLKHFGQRATDEIGVAVPYFSNYNGTFYEWHDFLKSCSLADALDTITLAFHYLTDKRYRDTAAKWHAEVSRIFAEENVSYRLDERGGVHFAVDAEFEVNRVASIAALGSSRYANVLQEFETAHRHLDSIPPNGKNAIWATFSAAEGLFRLAFASAARLGAKEAEKHISPVLQKVHAADNAALRTSMRVLASFKEWIEGAHMYRHEQGKEEVAQLPVELAVHMVSLGASYIRWLAEIDDAAAG